MSMTDRTPIPDGGGTARADRLEALAEAALRFRRWTPAITVWGRHLARVLDSGGRLLACGNGCSAAEAQHLTAELVGRFEDDRRPLAAIIVDVDHFKSYNDQHGHVAGDQALCAVALSMRAAADANVLLARWGGEEFAALLEDTDIDQAATLAERMRAAVELHGGALGGVTLSAGAASIGAVDRRQAPHPHSAANNKIRAAGNCQRREASSASDAPNRMVSKDRP